MLVLCSNGLTSEKLMCYMARKINKQKSAALVVTADNKYKGNNYHVKRCTHELKTLGLSVDVFDIDTQEAELLLNYDLVEFIGGNPFYLLNSIKKANAEIILKEVAKSKILIGWSAAVFAFGPSLDLVNLYSPEMNFIGLTDITGVSLIDFEILPHYSKFLSRFKNFEEKCAEYENRKNIKVIRISDGDGVIINKNKTIICRG